MWPRAPRFGGWDLALNLAVHWCVVQHSHRKVFPIPMVGLEAKTPMWESGLCHLWALTPKSIGMPSSLEHVYTPVYIEALDASEKAAQVFWSSIQLPPCRLCIQTGAGINPDLSQFSPNPYCFPGKSWWRVDIKNPPKAPVGSSRGVKV